MSGSSYMPRILKKIDAAEDPADVVWMIDALARERFIEYPQKYKIIGKRHYDFAAGVLCIILDPIKILSFRKAIESFRLQFVGVSNDSDLQKQFFGSINRETLQSVNDATEAIKLAISAKSINLIFYTKP